MLLLFYKYFCKKAYLEMEREGRIQDKKGGGKSMEREGKEDTVLGRWVMDEGEGREKVEKGMRKEKNKKEVKCLHFHHRFPKIQF